MKLIYASLGMAALGVATIQSAQAQSTDTTRSWSVSSSLRGFYDDNVNTTKNNKVDSFGVEVSPSVSFTLPLEQTEISASYTFANKWYDKAVNSGSHDHDDQTHTAALQVRHTFSERLLMTVQDSFVVGQEPDFLRVGNDGSATFQRISGDNIRNYGSIVFNAQVTRPFGVEVGYANTLFDYSDHNDSVARDGAGNPTSVNYSQSGLLDFMTHSGHIDGRWQLQPDTVGIVGYQFSADYAMQNQPIAVFTYANPADNKLVYSRDRESYSHYGYLGLEHSFRPDLTGSIRGGARYTDYYKSPDGETHVSPYLRSNLRWNYSKESFLDVGGSHDLTETDQISVKDNSKSITQMSDTTSAYLSLSHQIVPDLVGSVIGNFQYSTLNGGETDGDSQKWYGIGVNLDYRINRHLSANVGYNYDKVDGEGSSTDYDRNRVYLGATFVY